MNDRKSQIKSLVEGVLAEATPGFFGGFGAGFVSPWRAEIPSPPSAFELGMKQQRLSGIVRNPNTNPFLRDAARQERREVRQEITNLPATKKKLRRAKIGAVVGGLTRTAMNIAAFPMMPVAKAAWQNLFTQATSADAGTLRGKGYQV